MSSRRVFSAVGARPLVKARLEIRVVMVLICVGRFLGASLEAVCGVLVVCGRGRSKEGKNQVPRDQSCLDGVYASLLTGLEVF